MMPVKRRREPSCNSLNARSIGNVDPSLRRPITSPSIVRLGKSSVRQVTGQDVAIAYRFRSSGMSISMLLADHGVRRVVKHLFGGRVATLDQPVLVDRDDGIGGGGDDRAEPGLAFSQRLARIGPAPRHAIPPRRPAGHAILEGRVEAFQLLFRVLAVGDVFDGQQNQARAVIKTGDRPGASSACVRWCPR